MLVDICLWRGGRESSGLACSGCCLNDFKNTMFCLAEFEDHVCLPPTEIGIGSRLESVRRLLRMRCLDKVVEDAGHAVCLGDVLEVSV